MIWHAQGSFTPDILPISASNLVHALYDLLLIKVHSHLFFPMHLEPGTHLFFPMHLEPGTHTECSIVSVVLS